MARYLAMYLRLSQEDIDVKEDALKDESNSIHSQRLLIRRYVDERADLNALPVLEFADDGFTGTNFDRPNFQKMLSMIRSGEIYAVVVKDLSRFGRNYLEVGDYLEHIFPFLDVRFISVNDHYDSNDYLGTTGGIDVAFRNLVYQRYSQDLSAKVKSAMHMKMEKGKYVTHCPYGYKKQQKHQMIPDPVTAPIVREIFLAAIVGMKSTEIATMLNERGVPTPMAYKNLSRKRLRNDAMWSHQAVLRIIKEYKYTGAMVNFKCENETIRAKVQRKRTPDEWVVVENSHEAIITHEEYDAANASIRKVKPSEHSYSDQRDRVYYCAYCGRKLRKTFGFDEYYSCATQLYQKDSPCAQIRWSRSAVEEVLLAAYKGQLALMNEEYKKVQQSRADPIRENREMQSHAQMQAAECAAQNLQLYESFKAGEIDKETFMTKKARLTERKTELEKTLAELREAEETDMEKSEKLKVQEAMMSQSRSILQLSDKELKERMYDMIDSVIVYSVKEIEIHWKYADCFQEVTQVNEDKVS